MNIVLIGYRCCGKSSVGKKLACRMGWKFVDTDRLIEQSTGMRLHRLIQLKGWKYFRALERVVVSRISCADATVIATGGGTVIDNGNLKALKKNGWIVWLDVDSKIIRQRMVKEQALGIWRPPLEGKDPIDEIEQILEQRRPIYRKASDLVVDGGTISVEEVVEVIMKNFHRRGII